MYGQIIKDLREEHHLTQTELAKILNVSQKAKIPLISIWTDKALNEIELKDAINNAIKYSQEKLISGEQ